MRTSVPSVDLRPNHWTIVRRALRRHVPDREVLAFGSRATWTAKDYSDLDLAVMGEEPLSLRTVSALDEALGDSDLPFKVDVVDWARIDDSFRAVIRRHAVAVQAPTGVANATGLVGRIRVRSEGEEWTQKPLGQVIELKRGYDLPGHKRSPGPVPVVSSSGITGSHRESKVLGPGVVTGRYGTLGKVYYILDDFWPLNTTLYVRDFKGNDPRFVNYLLRGLDFSGHSDKAAVPGLNRNHLHEEPVRVPTAVGEQRAIAHILGTLDDKIELNCRMNETLEAMARALFKSWFVDFDPARAKMEGRDTGLPRDIADLFPDRMVDSEMGEIPEGWDAIPLDRIARFQNGLALQKFRPNQNEARLPVVKITQMRAGEANSGEWASATIKPECIIEDGDVLFSWSGSLLVKIWCRGRAALNQHLFKVTSERHPKWFYLQSLLSHLPTFRRIAQEKATTMGHIRRHHLTDALSVVPPDHMIAGAGDTFACLLERQIANELAGQTHSALRDALLPKLISGEIRVGDAEKVVDLVT